MIRIGILGVGHLGKIHLRLLKEIAAFEVVGFFDPDSTNAAKADEEFGVKRFGSADELIAQCDAVDVVTPTITHFDCASRALKQTKHIFIEKPIANTVKEAKQLMDLAHEADVKFMVGHVERFNPAFLAALPYFGQPMFIETHRLAQFNPRGTDVSVVLDLMIHDIDIVLSVVRSNIRKISASGVAVVSDTPDIANARIEFDNGCVANLTASRISMKNMRKTRFFQRDAYISVDFLDKETNVVRLKSVEGEPDPLSITIDLGKEKGIKQIYFDNPKVASSNAIKSELEAFAAAILQNKETPITADDGYRALNTAYSILEKIELTTDFISESATKIQ